jgi:hypothetical protein
LAALVGLAAIWSALWFGAAGRLEEFVGTSLAKMESSGARAACESLNVSGFPSNLALRCMAAAYTRDVDGISLKAGRLDAGWSVLSPMTATAALAGPGQVELPGLVPLELNWSTLAAETRLWLPRPSGVTIRTNDLVARSAADDAELFSLRSSTASATIDGEDIDIVLDSTDAHVVLPSEPVASLPVRALTLTAKVQDGARHLLGKRPTVRGTVLEIATLRLVPRDDMAMSANGRLTVDANGAISGELEVHLTDPDSLAAMLASAFPAHADEIKTGFEALAAMESPPGSGNGIKLRFVDGQAFLGFLPIGFVPALP